LTGSHDELINKKRPDFDIIIADITRKELAIIKKLAQLNHKKRTESHSGC